MFRKLGLMALAMTCAMAVFGAASASAATAYSCRFTDGLAGNISPGVGVTPFFNGQYTFSGDADCTIDATQVRAHIDSAGTFINVVCGTGLVQGSATVTAPGFDAITADYTIAFDATVGELAITGGDVAGGGGAVQILPKTGDCISGVTEFTVTGAFAAAAA
jgi:hypothetical protein